MSMVEMTKTHLTEAYVKDARKLSLSSFATTVEAWEAAQSVRNALNSFISVDPMLSIK
jgi:hypothetical protein